jgi:hypothetical protein
MEELRMSGKERIRLEAFGRVRRGELSVMQAAGLAGLSLRQTRRQWKRFKADGDAGLVHGLRGRLSNRRMPREMRERVVKRHQERYADFGPTLACEKLAEEGLVLSPDTLTALLKERGLWQRRRRRGRHRKRRERRACFGSLVQMDGSHHDWFEGRGGKCVLMVMIDDATNQTYARLYPAETMEAAFDVLGRWIGRHGLPRSLYVDRHAIYRDEDHPDRPTQFGRAMKDLGVELIQAHSPQAKGRVERRNAVFQDRLVKEMRLRKINNMAGGNALLEGKFLDELNGRYAISPRREPDLHRSLEAGTVLEEVLCVQERRVVGRDWCVRWRNRWLQIDSRHASLNLPRRQVLIRRRGDGQLIVEHKGERLTCRELTAKPLAARKKTVIVNNRRWKPDADHPWNRESALKADPSVSLAPATPARDLQTGKRKKAG